MKIKTTIRNTLNYSPKFYERTFEIYLLILSKLFENNYFQL